MVLKNKGNLRKIVLLVLLIILIFGFGFLLVDFVSSWLGLYLPLPGLSQIKSISLKNKLTNNDSYYLIEREELSKDKDRLSIIEEQNLIKEKELEKMQEDLNKQLEVIKDKENKLVQREKMINDREKKYDDRLKNISEQAVKLINMPPKDAVKILEQQSESDIVDILRAIDGYFEGIGRKSTSPYLLKLLNDINKEKASNVLRKLKYATADNENLNGVDVLDDEKAEKPPLP